MGKILRRAGVVLLVLVVGLGAWAWLSPWPSVLVIRALWPTASAQQVAAMGELEPRGVDVRHDVVVNPSDPDGRVDVYRPEAAGTTALPTVVWVHGGGFVTGTKEGMGTYLSHIAAAGYTVVAVENTVAPEARYPTPVDQVTTALDFLVDHAADLGVDATRIALAGDSAGAHIAAQTAMAVSEPGYAEDAGLPRADLPDGLRATILYSGAFDMTLTDSSSVVGRWMVGTMMWAYTGSKDPASDPHLRWASLPQHVDAHFPATFISTGPGDPLLRHSQVMATSFEQAGVAVTTDWYPDAPDTVGHEFQMDLRTPQARSSLKAMIAFVRAHLDTPVPLETPSDSW